ncbi:MAG: CoA transferase [Gemmatimonadetes bacterium]|nr:CoA transferase [Gemmatimonadota bacterium]
MNPSHGPLAGLKVIEFAGIGPAPFAGMMLADMGATVVRIDRHAPKALDGGAVDLLIRGRPTVYLDLKADADRARCLHALDHADVLIEGFRPGVMERLGLGPDVVHARNPRLVYGRVTGWGQDGPLATTAGHDINYIGLTGALHAIGGVEGPPTPPLNLVGDFGGGGMLLAFGVACAILQARATGRGQVVDAAMVDGASLLMAQVYGLRASGMWPGDRGTNTLDGGAHFYRCYECADRRWVAVGAIETKFYEALLGGLGLTDPAFRDQWDRDQWPAFAARLAAAFRARPRDAWIDQFAGTDACVTPVLTIEEVALHPHHQAREAYRPRTDAVEPAPAPRFSLTPPSEGTKPTWDEALSAFGLDRP